MVPARGRHLLGSLSGRADREGGGRRRRCAVLGANVAQQCLDAGILDEIIIHVAPVLVGDGVRLFDRAGGAAVKLTPISSAEEGGMTVLRYSLESVGMGRSVT
ncbi:MAG: hypothetical protein E6I22_03325 [Chloroflexi bacterium]|nr:MAG: hypothetical protein E6I22_03325 [Chloroflexota bacterium]TMG40980.1 MAG: hypothetical protein E6H92_01405 [Chloroflexota bacterium]